MLTLARGAATSIVGKLLGRVVVLVTLVLLARVLGPVAFGLYALGWTLLRLLGLVAVSGLDNGVIHFGAATDGRDRARLRGAVAEALAVAGVLGLLVAAVVYLAADAVARSLFGDPELGSVLRWFAPGFCFVALLRVLAAASRVRKRVGSSVLAEDIVQPTGHLALFLVLYAAGYRLDGAVWTTVLSYALAAALAGYLLVRSMPVLFDRSAGIAFPGVALLTFSAPTSLSAVFAVLMLWSDKLFLGALATSREVGLYTAVSQPALATATIMVGLSSAFAPIIANRYHRNEVHELEPLFRAVTKWALYLSLPVFLVLCLAPHEFISVLFGKEYVAGWSAMVILAVGQLLVAAGGCAGMLLIMTGRQRRWLVASMSMVVVNVMSALVLVPRYGMVGAAIATAAPLAGLSIIGLVDIRRTVGLWAYDRSLWKVLVAATVSGAVMLGAMMPLEGEASRLAVAAVVSLVLFPATVALLRLEPDELLVVRAVLHRAGIRRATRRSPAPGEAT